MGNSEEHIAPQHGKVVPLSVESESFNCPHCKTLTHQYWYTLEASENKKGTLPSFGFKSDHPIYKNPKIQDEVKKHWREESIKHRTGKVFFYRDEEKHITHARNIHLSKCYTCEDIAVWVHDKPLFPPQRTGPQPNEDLPPDIKTTYEEASSILNLSPRGAAALLRLCIQELLMHLGEKGKDINEDIKNLVKRGLDPRVQQALDIVRVVGNHAVHPGKIDLKDDQPTALKLFKLVNLITEKMISESKHVEEMFDDIIPEGTKQAIEKRDNNPQDSEKS